VRPLDYPVERGRSSEEMREQLLLKGSGYLLDKNVDDSFRPPELRSAKNADGGRRRLARHHESNRQGQAGSEGTVDHSE
jgi:hypothetical protein